MKVSLVYLSVLFVFFISSCCRKNYENIVVEGHSYTSVKSFGAKGNGKSDDRSAIQKAFTSGQDIYLPKGKYMLASKTIQTGILWIGSKNYPRRIKFEDGAQLVVSRNQPKDYFKPAVLLIAPKGNDIKSISIEGLSIDGRRNQHKIQNVGVFAYEEKGRAIRELILKDITIINMGGGGIHTQARYNDFSNIHTENSGSHGIGIINTTNKGTVNEFYLDGHTSINDGAYSIDFSGPKDPSNPSYVYPGYGWRGEAKNIVSKGSYYGIKTAGYWNLLLENVIIEDSQHNGFFINTNAPNTTLTLQNVTIRRAKGNGMSLFGKCNFEGRNIVIDNCGVGLKIVNADVNIDTLIVDGRNENIAGIRMGKSNVSLSNFTLKNNSSKDDYPIWVQGGKVSLRNGRFENNNSPNEIIIKDEVGDVTIDNVEFVNNTKTIKSSLIRNLKKNGKAKIVNSNFNNVDSRKIDDRGKTLSMKNNKGIKK